MLRTSDLDYHLPEDRIATLPAQPRDAARMLVLSRSDARVREDRRVRDLAEFLRPGDVLIVNASRVIPARLLGHRADTNGLCEGLYLGPGPAPGQWRLMLKARRPKPGTRLVLHTPGGQASGVSLVLIEHSHEPGEESAWVATLDGAPGESDVRVLERVGTTPLPPYIRAARKRHHQERPESDDRGSYQCVYAHASEGAAGGSVAAPTAGLHFTPALLDHLASMGVHRHEVTLHVGTGTFKPVECEFVEQHPMHAEWCSVPRDTASAIVRARREGQRVIAVGTTSARTLESFTPEELGACATGEGACERSTQILITPGHRFVNLDAMMTNFHLPRSTLLAMVAALLDTPPGTGLPRVQSAYAHAVEHGYRFYSFGDAMLVLP